MRSAATALIVFAGQAVAHPGHGAPESHIHGFGVEHVLLLAVVLVVLAFAVKKK